MSTLITSTAQMGTIKDAAGNNNAFVIHSTGHVTQSQLIAFHARYIDSSVGTLANGNYVVFQTVDTNKGNCYNNSTGVFTVPTGGDGTYYFYGRLLYDKNSSSDTDTNYKQLEFRKNNSLVGGINISHYYGRGDYDYVDGTMCVELAAGDTMRIYNSGNATLYAGSYSSFNGFKIG